MGRGRGEWLVRGKRAKIRHISQHKPAAVSYALRGGDENSYHSNLPNKSANVDEHVEVMVYSARSDGWINNDALAFLRYPNGHLSQRQLFRDQGTDVRLESTSSASHNDQTNDEGRKTILWLSYHRRYS